MAKDNEKELLALYRSRIKDRLQAKTRRRKQVEAGPQRLGGLLHSFFKQDDQALRRIEEAKAIMAWEGFVGEIAARFSQALRLRNDTLIVRVKDPLWMQQLSLLKQELLKKYRANFPSLRIRDIFFTNASRA